MNKQRCLCFFALLLFPALALAQSPPTRSGGTGDFKVISGQAQKKKPKRHGLKALVSGKTVTLNWTETTAGVTFNMYRLNAACPATVTAGTFTKLNASPITSSPYMDSGTPSGTYCYYATAFLSTASPSESAPSNLLAVVVPPSTPDPPVLTNSTVN